MTERLYYNDAYTTNFSASLRESVALAGQVGVVLQASYFYPSSGGQPHDLGTLNGIPVVDVQVRPEDGAVLHLLQAPLNGTDTPLEGVIDWQRRFDHMQQHSGQHILSRAFEEVVGADTLSFHLSANSVTIDINREDIPQSDLDAIEALCNQIVVENRPVRAWFPSAEELADLQLRKIPDKAGEALRVVDIGGFDLCACGGTHVRQTGEIGQIKLIRLERAKQKLRVEFRCGGRALEDYRSKNALLLGLAAELTTAYADLPDVVDKLRQENKALQKELQQARQELLHYEASTLWQAARDARPQAPQVVVAEVLPGRDSAALQGLVNALVQQPQTLAILGLPGEKAHLVVGSSEDAGVDAVALLKAGLATLGIQRGGGRPSLAQSGGFAATEAQLQAAIDAALNLLGH